MNTNHRFLPETSNTNPESDPLNFNGNGPTSQFSLSRLKNYTFGDMELLMYQQQQRVAELEDKHKQCKCKHDTQATAHLVKKVAYLEEQLKSKDEQLRMNEQLQQAAVLDKTKPKGAAKQ